MALDITYDHLILDNTLNTWSQFYERALVELDEKRLAEMVKAAEASIHERLFDLRKDSDHHAERQAIEDALRTLKLLGSGTVL